MLLCYLDYCRINQIIHLTMEKLQQNDCLIGATEKQYKEIVKITMKDSPDKSIIKFMTDNCIVRGGLFWSDRVQNVVPAKLKSGNRLQYPVFLERLKNTLSL